MAERNLNSTVEKPSAACKEFGISKQMFSDSNTDTYSFKQLMSLGEEKENNPEAGQLPQMAKARRVSLCNGMNQASRSTLLVPLPRRNSLMPLPAAKNAAAVLQLPQTAKARRVSLCNGGAYPPPRTPLIPLPRWNSLMPLPAAKNAAAVLPPLDNITEHLSSPPLYSPPVVSIDKGSRSKRINSILRQSLQTKVIIRPSLAAQAGRKASVIATTQGTDGARKAARRVPVSGGNGQRVQQKRDKERGWNNATSLRN